MQAPNTIPSDSFETPQWLFEMLDTEFKFTLDAAASPENAKCERYYTNGDNALVQPWRGEVVWCNPPYSGQNPKFWMRKACCEFSLAATVVCLVPVSVTSRWWRKYAVKGEVFYLHKRPRFSGRQTGGMRDSALIVFRRPRWYPLGDSEQDRSTRSRWEKRWRKIMYPAADLVGRWWNENSAPIESNERHNGVKLRLKKDAGRSEAA